MPKGKLNMPFEAFVETLDGLDETAQENYKEVEGGYAFQLNPVTFTTEVDGKPKNFLYAAEEINGLSSSLSKERIANKTNNTTIKAFEKKYNGVDLEALQGFQDKYNTVNEALTELTSKYDTLSAFDTEAEAEVIAETKSKATIKRKQKEWQTQRDLEVLESAEALTGLQNTNKVLESQLKGVLVTSKATDALIKAGVEENLELVLPQLMKQLKSEVTETGYSTSIVDAEGLPRIKVDGTNVTIDDAVVELQALWPSQFKIKAKPGGGKSPQGGAVQTPKIKLSADEKIAAGLAARRS
ncbi:hypothetical protein KAU11_11330 [Candidatus Babeliales bacterium]|nr:hypothetical protein [Candidatus Babeliales bacterium]